MPAPVVVAGYVCAVISGIVLSVQGGVNSTLGQHAGKSFASVVSFSVGLAVLVVFYLIEVHALGGKGPTRANVASVPWWGWIGGVLGAFYVAVVVIFAQKLGAATLMAIFVTAQLTTAVVLDSLGWIGFRKRPLHWARILGLVMMIGGVILITYFNGDHVKGGAAAGAPPPVALQADGTAQTGPPVVMIDPGSGTPAQGPAAGSGTAVATSNESASSADGGGQGRRLLGRGMGGAGGAGTGGDDYAGLGVPPGGWNGSSSVPQQSIELARS